MSRRGKGEGSIYKLGDGRWAAAVDLGWSEGQRRRKVVTGKTRTEVATKLKAVLNAAGAGLPIPSDRLTVAAFLDRWLTQTAKPALRPRTFESYAMVVRRHLTPAIGRKSLAKLSPDDVQAYCNRKIEEGLSERTVQYHHAILRRALEQATRWGLTARNVAKLVTPPRVEREEVRPLDGNQTRALLEASRGTRLEALYAIAVSMGLRQSEALGLTWGAVDLHAGTLTVRRSLQRYGGEYHLDEPKTRKSWRTLPFPAPVVELLKAHRARQLEERLAIGPAWDASWDLVFCMEDGTPLSARSVVRDFKATLTRAGLPAATRYHDLRHGAASFALATGTPLKVVQELLGHSTISITADVYGHIAEGMQREATDRIGALLFEAPAASG